MNRRRLVNIAGCHLLHCAHLQSTIISALIPSQWVASTCKATALVLLAERVAAEVFCMLAQRLFDINRWYLPQSDVRLAPEIGEPSIASSRGVNRAISNHAELIAYLLVLCLKLLNALLLHVDLGLVESNPIVKVFAATTLSYRA